MAGINELNPDFIDLEIPAMVLHANDIENAESVFEDIKDITIEVNKNGCDILDDGKSSSQNLDVNSGTVTSGTSSNTQTDTLNLLSDNISQVKDVIKSDELNDEEFLDVKKGDDLQEEIVCKTEETKQVVKRGRKKKEESLLPIGGGKSKEPVMAEIRRSGRKRKQKIISYIDLVDDSEAIIENDNDEDWDYKTELSGQEEIKPFVTAKRGVGRRKMIKSLSKDFMKEKSKKKEEMDGESPNSNVKSKKKVGRQKKNKSSTTPSISISVGEGVELDKVKEEKSGDEFHCNDCYMVFLCQDQLKNHEITCKEVRSLGVEPMTFNKKMFVTKMKHACPVCHKVFVKRNGVKRHLALKHTNLVQISCALCYKKIGDINGNFQHFQTQHQSSFPEKKASVPGTQHCPVCGDTLGKFSHLKQHVVNAHSNLIHVTCSLCQRAVGTMLDYLQHFTRYHVSSSLTRDKGRGACTTTPPISQTKSDLVCIQCNKTIDNHKLLVLHMLSHKINENTEDIVSQTSVNSGTGNETNDDGKSRTGVGTDKPLDEFPLSLTRLPTEAENPVRSEFSFLGYDLVLAINRSLIAMSEMASKLHAELNWTESDCDGDKEDLGRKLNKLLHFSSGISDIGKFLLLVIEESRQLKGKHPYDGDDVKNKYDEFDIIYKSEEEDDDNDDDLAVHNDLIDDEIAEQNNISTNSNHHEVISVEDSYDDNDKWDVKHYTSISRPRDNRTEDNSLPNNTESGDKIGDGGNLENETESVGGKSNDEEGGQKDTEHSQVESEAAAGLDSKPNQKSLMTTRSRAAVKTKPTKKKGKRKFICKKCGKQLSKAGGLTHHMLVHSDARPFKCKSCPSAFKSEEGLKRHAVIHYKDNRYKCDFCDFSGRALKALHDHMEDHPGEELFSCDQCKHKDRTTYDLAIHKKIHEPKKCKHCDFEARHLYELKTHERKNHAKLFCTHCSYACFSNYQLNRHMRRHVKTERDKIYCCELCGATFDTSRKLAYHVVRHTDKTPLSCTQCEYKCSSRSSYDAHMLKHAGLRPYKCNLCDASFYRTSYLKQHKLMHSDEKQFECRYCRKGFKYKYNCQEHEMIHTGEKKFKCKVCNFACRRRKFLVQHLEEHKARGSDVEMSDDGGGNGSKASVKSESV